jgi:hypothetical protein
MRQFALVSFFTSTRSNWTASGLSQHIELKEVVILHGVGHKDEPHVEFRIM